MITREDLVAIRNLKQKQPRLGRWRFVLVASNGSIHRTGEWRTGRSGSTVAWIDGLWLTGVRRGRGQGDGPVPGGGA